MSLVRSFTPVLDGGLVNIGDGSVQKRALRIGSGEYPLPAWARTESGMVIPIDTLPWQGVLEAGQLEVLSSDPNAGVSPIFEWNPNDYNTTQELIDANTNDFNLGPVSLVDGETLFDGSTGKVMRSFYDGDGSSSDCNYDLTLPGALTEFWLEIDVRFNAAWTMDGVVQPDDKTFFFNPQTGSRWEIHYGLGARIYGGPSANPSDFAVVSDGGAGEPLNDLNNDVWNGQWIRIRLKGRYGAAGAFWWIHDDLVLISDTVQALYGWGDGEPIDTGDGNYLNFVRLGANANPNGGLNAYRDWGRLRLFDQDPGFPSTN